jgi:outer membrane receptor protein involved in Fe transport
MAKVEEQLGWKPSRRLAVTTGGTFENFFAIPQGADLNAPVRSHDQPGTILDTTIPEPFVKLRYTNTGAFGQAQYTVSPAATVTLGARADYNSRFGATFNPRAGLVLQARPGTTLKMLYGSAYLAPSPFQSFSHYGSFQSADGGQTYSSTYWHLGNPDLKPQRKKTVEINLLQALGESLRLGASASYSRLDNLVKTAAADRAYSGDYLGWPVDYIDFPVNEGRANVYGGTMWLDYLHLRGSERRIAANLSLSFADGRVWEDDTRESSRLPIGAMAPVQLRASADVDWRRWTLAPRLSLSGRQRLLATVDDGSSSRRRTLDGYATVDLTVRRLNVLRGLDAFLTVENAFDSRYRHINGRAYTNPEEFVGVPQNPRRMSAGITVKTR